MSSAFEGLLTRNESGELFHCGGRVKWSMCLECDESAGCFVAYCWDWDCDWVDPDCFESALDSLLVLDLARPLAAGACLAVIHS